MPGRGLGQKAAALARQVLLDLALARREELEARAARIDGFAQAGVHDDGREPARRQRLLHAGGRQRIDERAGIADEQPAVTGVGAGAIRRRVPTPRAVDRAMASAIRSLKIARLRDLGEIDIRRRSAAREIRSLRIDHRRDVTHAAGRPAPTTSSRRRTTRSACASRRAPATAFAPPLADQRDRSRALVILAQTLRARDHAGAAGAVEHEMHRCRHVGRQRVARLRRRPSTARQHHVGERVDIDLPAARAAGERLDARRRSLPHHTVLPVDRMKPARSIASLTPIASNSLPQLGGSDTARPRPGWRRAA